jgi:DNA-binding winged helix-turn-helix (wHTH) protein/TolB-like protein
MSRKSLEIDGIYEFGDLRLEPVERRLLRGNSPVALTPKAFDLLLFLVQHSNRLLTKDELMTAVWPDAIVEEGNLTVTISALRKALGECEAHHYIETVPKKGYRFVVPVTEITAEKATEGDLAAESTEVNGSGQQVLQRPGAFPISEPVLAQKASSKRFWSRSFFLVVTVVLTLISGLGYFAWHSRSVSRNASQPPHRLAVIPFRNLRESANDDFLGFSLADAVITKLGYVSQLGVRPSYAVERYRTQPIDIPRVASELNADALLTGTFLHDGDDLRIACQLIDARSQNILWNGSFDLRYDKLLTVQDDVAREIIRGLQLTLSPAEVERLKPEAAVNPFAYEYYLRGVDLYSKSDFPMAIKMLEKSAELAPDYAKIWAYLGKSYAANASFQFGGGEQYRKAQAAFERSLVLQLEQIEARIYMANMFTDTGRVERAVPLLREALKTNPNQAEIHWELGYAYRFAGMLNESLSECERGRTLDPSVKLNSSTLTTHLYLGQYDRFLETLPKTEDVALIVFYRGFGEYYKKNWDRAAASFDQAFKLDGSLLQAQIGKALALGIRHQQVQGLDVLRAVETKINQRGVGDPEAQYKIAQAYAMLGEKASALRVLKRSIQNGFFSYPYFLTDPLLDSLRNEGEFTNLMAAARQRHQAFVTSFF